MQEKTSEQQIDELIARIDNFMKNGGGRMNVSGGAGEAKETHTTCCCGEIADKACNTPVK